MVDILEIHFSGENISPENIRIGEIAVILEAVENVLLSVVSKKHAGLSKEHLTIGLHSINSGSLGLQFTSKFPEVVNPAFEQVAISIKSRKPESIPFESHGHFEKIISFVKKHQAQADFIVVNGKSKTLATLTPEFELPKPGYITGQTTIYGKIVRVGGVDPKVEVKTISEQTLYCPFEVELASQLGARLYQLVGLNGEARWNTHSLEIIDFRVTEISDYQETSIVDAFQSLSEVTGDYYADIDDVNAYITELRREE
jgi:hypothetical protein